MIAARKIGAPDRAREQHVADERDPRRRIVNDDMARRVSRRMRNAELHALELQLVAVLEIAVRRHVAHAGEAVAAARCSSI